MSAIELGSYWNLMFLLLLFSVVGKKEVKFTLWEVMEAQKGSRDRALLFL